eukprot:SAG31_NODE_20_length_34168_cov_33.651296_15_plen_82_part_00
MAHMCVHLKRLMMVMQKNALSIVYFGGEEVGAHAACVEEGGRSFDLVSLEATHQASKAQGLVKHRQRDGLPGGTGTSTAVM